VGRRVSCFCQGFPVSYGASHAVTELVLLKKPYQILSFTVWLRVVRKEGNDKGGGEREGDMGVSCQLVSFSYSNCAMSMVFLNSSFALCFTFVSTFVCQTKEQCWCRWSTIQTTVTVVWPLSPSAVKSFYVSSPLMPDNNWLELYVCMSCACLWWENMWICNPSLSFAEGDYLMESSCIVSLEPCMWQCCNWDLSNGCPVVSCCLVC
jgi:hypothetical protein